MIKLYFAQKYSITIMILWYYSLKCDMVLHEILKKTDQVKKSHLVQIPILTTTF